MSHLKYAGRRARALITLTLKMAIWNILKHSLYYVLFSHYITL